MASFNKYLFKYLIHSSITKFWYAHRAAHPLRNFEISKWKARSSCHCQATKLNSFCKLVDRSSFPFCICLIQWTNNLHNLALFVSLLVVTDLKNATSSFISWWLWPFQWTNQCYNPCPINLVYVMTWVTYCCAIVVRPSL